MYSMYNVVWYDGVDAYVSKMILKSDKTKAIKDAINYLKGNGEVLKVDLLYTLERENILAILKDYGESNPDNKLIADRFSEMYL